MIHRLRAPAGTMLIPPGERTYRRGARPSQQTVGTGLPTWIDNRWSRWVSESHRPGSTSLVPTSTERIRPTFALSPA
jgi:hypothetical protein